MRRGWIVVVLAGLLGLAGTALAKVNPYIEEPDAEWSGVDNPTRATDDPTAAVALFGRLAADDVDAFIYPFAAPHENWPFQVIVPVCGDHFTNFYPSVALVGPGLEKPTADALPFELADDAGAVIFEPEQRTERRSNTNNAIGLRAYARADFFADIPATGDYWLVVWSPDAAPGAYAVATGYRHDEFGARPEAELRTAFRALETGSWMGVDCNAPVTATCPATAGQVGAAAEPEAPERSKVGDGFVLAGAVVDAANCQPIAEARITFWLVNEQGEYDDDHRGTLATDEHGLYRIESNRPGQYGPPPHVHLQITAPGYQTLITEYILEADVTAGEFPIALLPE